MGDQYDTWFERGQRLGYEGQNLEEYIEKRIAESYDGKERLCKLKLARKKEVSERREREFANEAEKRKAEAEEHEREHARKKRTWENEARREREDKRWIYFRCARKRVLTPIQPLRMLMQRHRGQSYQALTNSATTSMLISTALNDSPRAKPGL